MIVNKFIEVTWHKLNKDYYESLGYQYTKQRDKFICRIEDLSVQSKEKISVQCDYCGKLYNFEFKGYARNHPNYLTHKHECRECEIKRIWNNVIDRCKELDFELMSNIKDYKTHKTEINFICKIHKEYGIQKVTVNTLLVKNCGCKLCSNEKKGLAKLIDFKIVKQKFDKAGYQLLDTEYISAKTFMKYICPHHPEQVREITYDKLSQGQGCWDCGNEKISNSLRTPIDEVKKIFDEKNLILLENEYKNNSTPLRYLCPHHLDKGEQSITVQSLKVCQFGCNYCAIEYRASLLSKGGITPLHNYLREKIDLWNKSSMKECKYKCVLTGGRFDTVHHLYGFNLILLDILNNLNLPLYGKVNDYTEYELQSIVDECLKLHNKLLGVCLVKPLHLLFHSLYGRGNNIPEQFEEFKQRYSNFEFDDLLEDKYKYCNVLKEVS